MLLHFYSLPLPGGGQRTVRVCLPTAYQTTDRHFSVLYALDGQNLFEASTAFGRRHWRIGEALDKLPLKHKSIVVGIDNGGANRVYEYSPFRRGHNGGGAAEHLRFITDVVKPLIDKQYRTLAGREHTGIAGSSLGGLLALYAGLQRGDVFGKAGVLSPALWFNPQVLTLAGQSQRSKIYLCGSKTESQGMEGYLQRSYWALRNAGWPDDQFRVVVRDRGRHKETFWGREFPKMQRWLFE